MQHVIRERKVNGKWTGRVAASHVPRRGATVDVVAVMTNMRFWLTNTQCEVSDPIPDDAKPFLGYGDASATPTGTYAIQPAESVGDTDPVLVTSFTQGRGAPADSAGVVGDSYLDADTGDLFKKGN